MPNCKPYPSYVSDGEWAFVAPYLALVRGDPPRRYHDLREVFDALRWVLRTGSPWRYMSHDSPPWEAVLPADPAVAGRHGVFEAIVHYLRAVLRLAWGREPESRAVVLDARMLRFTPESGARAGYGGHKRKHGSKAHMAVNTLGHLFALRVAAASEQERA